MDNDNTSSSSDDDQMLSEEEEIALATERIDQQQRIERRADDPNVDSIVDIDVDREDDANDDNVNDDNVNDDDDDDEDDDDENDNDDGDDDDDDDEVAAAAAAAARKERKLKLNTILDDQDKFPLRSRNRIDELVEEYLLKLEDDIYNMLCNKRNNEDVNDNVTVEDYCGLDDNRDTNAEVETALRFFPDVLSRDDDRHEYPIHKQLFITVHNLIGENLVVPHWRAISFIPLLVRLGILLGNFFPEEKGGLLTGNVDDENVLQLLMTSSPSISVNEESNDLVDRVFLLILIEFRQQGFFIKSDIQEYWLVSALCLEYYFAERRFQFLIEWDPTSLLQPGPNEDEWLPLLDTTSRANGMSSIRGFRCAFKYGIRYYPYKKGLSLLFRKDYLGNTAFQLACNKYGRNEVMEVIESVLIQNSNTPVNVIDALVMAAINENIHYDCIYFLLRRTPDILTKLLATSLPPLPPSLVSVSASREDINGDEPSPHQQQNRKRKRG